MKKKCLHWLLEALALWMTILRTFISLHHQCINCLSLAECCLGLISKLCQQLHNDTTLIEAWVQKRVNSMWFQVENYIGNSGVLGIPCELSQNCKCSPKEWPNSLILLFCALCLGLLCASPPSCIQASHGIRSICLWGVVTKELTKNARLSLYIPYIPSHSATEFTVVTFKLTRLLI